ncbi:hypothetical protein METBISCDRAFT_29008 [Metschnikowia bicuspidata]|uniref:Uncharacterized protein n=1 Tax=Metschnikowia bicuspidata TaxID=27322 RepID=A0A4P9Z9D0_9ASCO|nr:hypothetical protein METBISCDRAFT_29008 [Metschnikowia bicuspidata]
MQLVGDRSPENFQKFLHLKNISARDMAKYTERFRLQTALRNSLKDESFMNDVVVQPADGSLVHPASQPKQERVNARDASSRSPEPHLLDFLNNAKLQSRSLNNALRDLSLTGENHVTKINENFRSFGKFFRKDSADD